MILRLAAAFVLSLVALTSLAQAHEIRPAYLQIDERAPQRYELLWKVPTKSGMVPDIRPAFGPGFTLKQQPGDTIVDGFAIFRYSLTGDTALPGTTLTIDNLERKTIDTLVNIALLDGTDHSLLLRPREISAQIPEAPSAWQVVKTYTKLGVEHILLGIDHLLFVLALLLLVRNTWMLVKVITAFTVAHSITLALAALGWAQIPQAPVEAVIALSIMFVAAETIRPRRHENDLVSKAPWVIAFAFGLLHGLGFGGALKEIGLPQSDVPLALLTFNLGVEAGQLLFVFAVLGLKAVIDRALTVKLPWARTVAGYGIGSLAAVWFVQRVGLML